MEQLTFSIIKLTRKVGSKLQGFKLLDQMFKEQNVSTRFKMYLCLPIDVTYN